jgi:hypothetical protein
MPIPIECDACGKRYKVDESHAGKSTRCKVCGERLEIPPLKGGPILRHEARERPFELAVGDSEAIEKIGAHIEAHLGPVSGVFHELISDLVHVDIHLVPPTDGRPFHTLVTSGMSDQPMSPPAAAPDCRVAELIIGLPPDWPMDQESWSDERYYWPVRWLKMLSRLPHEYKTWLWHGHTVPNGDPPEPFSEDTDLCCALLLPPFLTRPEFDALEIDADKTIHFFALVPLYREEMDFKLRKGTDALIERLVKAGVDEVLDVKRKNVCKRGFKLF